MNLYVEKSEYMYLKGRDLVSSIFNRIINYYVLDKIDEIFSNFNNHSVCVSYKEKDKFWYCESLEAVTEDEGTIFKLKLDLTPEGIFNIDIENIFDGTTIIGRLELDEERMSYYFNGTHIVTADYTYNDNIIAVSIMAEDESHDINMNNDEKGFILSYVSSDGCSKTYRNSIRGYRIFDEEDETTEYVVDEVTNMISQIFNNRVPILKCNTGHYISPTHFDDTGFPYKGQITEGFSRYNINKSEELFNTINHPEGTHLIKSVVIEDRIYDVEEILIKDDTTDTYYNQLLDILSVYKNHKMEIIYNMANNYRYDIEFTDKSVRIKYNNITILERVIVDKDKVLIYYDENLKDHEDTINEDIVF